MLLTKRSSACKLGLEAALYQRCRCQCKEKTLNALRLDVEPGNYTVRLHQQIDGKITALAGPQTFEVERIRKNVLAESYC